MLKRNKTKYLKIQLDSIQKIPLKNVLLQFKFPFGK